MTTFDRWVTGTVVVGGMAASLATVILWMLLTRPLALAEALSRLR